MASQTFSVLLSWACWHRKFPHTWVHIGRKILPHSIKQLLWKTRCTRSDENIRISHLKETYRFIPVTALTWERNNIQASLPYVPKWRKSKLMLMDEATHIMAQEAGTGEAVREEPLPAAHPGCLMQNWCWCIVCEGSHRVKGRSDFQHGKFPCLHLPEMKNMGCLSSNCLWVFNPSCSSSVQLELSLLPTLWGRLGLQKAQRSMRNPCREPAMHRPSLLSGMASPPLSLPFFLHHCFFWGVNYQWHLLEKKLGVLTELLCSCCSFWLQDCSSRSLRSLSCCSRQGVNSPEWLRCAETFLPGKVC